MYVPLAPIMRYFPQVLPPTKSKRRMRITWTCFQGSFSQKSKQKEKGTNAFAGLASQGHDEERVRVS